MTVQLHLGDCVSDTVDPMVFHPLFAVGELITTPRDLELLPTSSARAYEVNRTWHSSMPSMDSYRVCNPCFIAVAQNIVYAVALWSLPIAANRLKDGYNCLELRRFAIADYAPRNTASWMLSRMEKQITLDMPDIKKLISYQDTEHHHGTIYKASNWTLASHGKYISWNLHSKRPGRIEQSTAPKIRWEKLLIRKTHARTPRAQQLTLEEAQP